MLSKGDCKKKPGGSSANEKFIKDIETISKAFYADKTLPLRLASSTVSSRSKSVGKFRPPDPKTKPEDTKKNPKNSSEKDKKSSIWSWKSLKALTHARDRRFNCCFSLIVHSIENLPPLFEDIYLVVHWKRRDNDQMTIPVRIYDGVAKFGEQLTHSCSVYGTRSGPHHSVKYEARHFLMYVSVYNSPEVDLGKHWVDLTRLLPLTLEELEEEKSSGEWTTSFRLSGEAKGATMNVSFGYVVIENNAMIMPSDKINDRKIRRARSFSGMAESDRIGEDNQDIKELHEVLPVPRLLELSDSVNIIYEKLDQEMSNASDENKLECDSLSLPDVGECKMTEFCVTDKGIEELTKDHVKPEDGLEADFASVVARDEDAPLHSSALQVVPYNGEESICTSTYEEREDDMSSNESLMKELEVALSCTLDLVNEELDCHEDDSYERDHKKGKSTSLDGDTDSVANDFLEMLEQSPFNSSSESEPESPRELLLRQFENDTFANGGLLDLDIYDDQSELVEDFHHSSAIESDTFKTKSKASMIEDLENEALMREWGFNEAAFQDSPSSGSDGFDSSIDLFHEDPLQLPPLAEGVGPFVQTKNGGFLRSMNPVLFMNSKNGGSVIMQVSNPVVVPAEMGSSVMDVLQCLASVGIEKLSMQANKLMPLEDITGKSIQQIAWDSASLERQDLLQHEAEDMQNMPRSRKFDSSSNSSDTEYVSIENLAPLAMDKIEALSIEGLRIQSGMSNEDAPSNISAQSIGELSALKGKTVNVGGSQCVDGTCGLQLLDVKDSGEDVVEGLMGLSLTLDEWTKLDSGKIEDDDLVSERTSKILAAHHANSLDQFLGRSNGDKKRGRSKKYGLLGNNFTVALMVQLRDPLRNYEPVGTPMLALIQVERVFIPPKPKIYGTISLTRKSEEEEELVKCDKKGEILERTKEEEEEEKIPRYKITEVHVAGVKTEQGKKKLWGSTNQQQSGSRWLLANGMGKKNKHPLMKSKSKSTAVATGPASAATTTTVRPGDTLWSISSRVYGTGDKWKELAALNPHIRNPNVIFPNETIKLR